MTREEALLRELCVEVVYRGIESERFTQLWLALGVNLDGSEFDIAQKILSRHERVDGLGEKIYH